MKPSIALPLCALSGLLLAHTAAHAMDAKYRQQLERSGCTQVSEIQGCDIHKSKTENAKAGFVPEPSGPNSTPGAQTAASPYAGRWIAVGPSGGTVAEIQIDAQERVTLNGKAVKAQRRDGGLMFWQGFVTYFLHGDRSRRAQDHWHDSDAQTRGSIQPR